ncbi:MAG: hypothetical protein KGL39_42400 [Patescibacteria group bacterium]|nr:hypothetical protein [Patescibacteria group bacterium]
MPSPYSEFGLSRGDTTTNRPANASEGAIFYNETTGTLQVYTGTAWKDVGPGNSSGALVFTDTESVASGASATLEAVKWAATTITITGSTNITTAGGFNYMELEQPTFTSASAVAITKAATFKIDNAPAVGGSTTITTGYAFWVAAGLTELDGGLTLGAGSNLTLDTGTAAATAGAATLNKQSGTITSESITTAAGSVYTLTLTNSLVTASSRVFASVDNGTNTRTNLIVQKITPGSGSVTIDVKNDEPTNALNGTIKINFWVAP